MKRTHRPLTVLGLVLGLGMGALEATIVSTAMPTVIGELGGINHYSWVFTAYMLSATVATPLFGKLADLYGRKPLILSGLAVFLVGSAASGQAQSMNQLILFRFIQGLGAGAIQPIALTVVGDLFDLEERAKIQGLFGAIWGVSGLAGPLLGGLIVKALSWRWVFYINLPLGLASVLVLVLWYHERIEPKPARLDGWGSLTLSLAILAVLSATVPGNALWAVPTAAVCTGLFLLAERRAPEPVLPLELFKHRVLAVSSPAGALVGAALMAATTFLPLYVQAVMGRSPAEAGAAITPTVVGWPIASTIGGRILPRVGFRPLVRLGTLIAALATALMAWELRPDIPLLELQLLCALFGVGLGLANTALLIAVQTSVPWERRGVATASTMFFRNIGGTLAGGLLGAVLTAALTRDPSITLEVVTKLLSPERATLSTELLARLAVPLQAGLSQILWITAAISAAAAVVGWLFPYVPTRAQVPVEGGASAGAH